jgi:hypothetical protein
VNSAPCTLSHRREIIGTKQCLFVALREQSVGPLAARAPVARRGGLLLIVFPRQQAVPSMVTPDDIPFVDDLPPAVAVEPLWKQMARYTLEREDVAPVPKLNPRERAFVEQMIVWWGRPSRHQLEWLAALYSRFL